MGKGAWIGEVVWVGCGYDHLSHNIPQYSIPLLVPFFV